MEQRKDNIIQLRTGYTRANIDDMPAKKRGNDFSHIGSLNYPMPKHIFLKLGGVATAEEAKRNCSLCGEIPPIQVQGQGWRPGRCKCYVKEHLDVYDQQGRTAQHEALAINAENDCAKCYTWLGPDWSDSALAGKTFDNFTYDAQPTGLVAAIRIAEQRRGNLILWSDQSWGTGKTHLASAICNEMIQQNIPCRFTTAQNLFNAFGARMEHNEGYNDLIASAGSTPLLVIDDLDKVHMAKSGYKESIFFEILNKRYLRKLPTVITTNVRVAMEEHDIVGISGYIGRAAVSRLCATENGGLKIVEMNGADYRRKE